MTVLGYLAALTRAGLLVGATAVAAASVRQRLGPEMTGTERHLAGALLGLAGLLSAAQLLGAVGWLSYWPLLAMVVALAIAAIVWPKRPPRGIGPTEPSGRDSSLGALGIVALAMVGAVWAPRIAHSYRFGIQEVDSLRYHLPMAVQFAQHHSVTGLHYLELDHLATVAPSNSELLSAVAISTTGNDVLVPLISLVWLAVALASGWCIGRRLGSGDAGLAAAALTAIVPLSAMTAPGSAKNDLAVLGLLMACAALLPSFPANGRRLWLPAIAAGLAVSTKLTAVAPVLVLAVLVVVAWRASLRQLLGPASALLATGSFWYARNLVATGSVVPASDFGIGPLRLSGAPDPVLERTGFSILDRAGDRAFWREVPHGLHLALGPGWAVILALAVLTLCVTAWSGERNTRRVALVAMITALAYLVTPYSAGGSRNNPWLFPINLRFAFPALALSLVLLPSLEGARSTRRWTSWTIGIVLLTPFAASDPIWRTRPRTYAVVGLAVALGIGALLAGSRMARPHRVQVFATAMVAVVGISIAGYWVQHGYFERRYRQIAPNGAVALNSWAQDIDFARIGIVGITMSYPLYGRDLDNTVEYLGIADGGTFRSYPTCEMFLEAVGRGRYDYLVVGDFKSSLETAPESGWAAADEALRPVLRNGSMTAFRVDGRPLAGSCAHTEAALVPLPVG